MRFVTRQIAGVYLVELDTIDDHRGFFARSFCMSEFRDRGLDPVIAQCSVSWNHKRGTLRGMHFQAAPHAEAKLVRCTRGAVYDVVVDLRPESPTYLKWDAMEINADNRTAVYIPKGCGHGFQSLCDNTEILYHMSEPHHPGASSGVRWNDPAFAIEWPIAEPILSDKDRCYPDFQP
jgi:dTDP-4-dehydrorhamnose 3,5-epimerase